MAQEGHEPVELRALATGAGAFPDDPDARLTRVVHDLRTPLTVVAGFADLLVRRDDLTPDQRADFLGRIADAAHELQAILDAESASRPRRPAPGLGGDGPPAAA